MARKKKKNTFVSTRNVITELDGWKTGDRCFTVFAGDAKPSMCDIIEFHPTDSVTPAVSVTEVVTGRYRVAAMMAIAESAKEAKLLAPGWQSWLKEHKTKKLQQERRRRLVEQKALAEQSTAVEE
jgi:hypothetical protein